MQWAPTKYRLHTKGDRLVDVAPLLDIFPDCSGLLADGMTEDDIARGREAFRGTPGAPPGPLPPVAEACAEAEGTRSISN